MAIMAAWGGVVCVGMQGVNGTIDRLCLFVRLVSSNRVAPPPSDPITHTPHHTIPHL